MTASSGSDLNLFFHKKDVIIALLAFWRKENYLSIGKVECSNNAGTGVQRFFLGEALMTLVKIENTLNVNQIKIHPAMPIFSQHRVLNPGIFYLPYK